MEYRAEIESRRVRQRICGGKPTDDEIANNVSLLLLATASQLTKLTKSSKGPQQRDIVELLGWMRRATDELTGYRLE